jgi:hypothetical protein
MNQLTNTTSSRTLTTVPNMAQRPLPVAERRERGFGVGYGNSSGYASGKRYTPRPATARFRFA